MFISFFENLRAEKIPVSLREFLAFLESLSAGLATYDLEGFYYLGRTIMVKDEKNLDKFDRVFSKTFNGLENISVEEVLDAIEIPKDWLEKLAEKHLSEDEKNEVKSQGGFEKLMETLKKRLEEQKGRHQGGSKWVGTAGTSPFGAYGYNPEGIRIGQNESRHQRAIKVWDKREFSDFDDDIEIGTRNIKMALRRLRRWARDDASEEFDLDTTIKSTAKNGYLNIETKPEKKNAVKVLLFLDVGGSMDPHVKAVEELFSASKTEFKHLEYFYFHNCLYEGVWKENQRRWDRQVSTTEIMRTYGSEYKCIFVGDASMSPYEIAYPGGANEHYNEESGEVWLRRAKDTWEKNLWINPLPEEYWKHTQSIQMIQHILGNARMVPMTLKGIESGMQVLSK